MRPRSGPLRCPGRMPSPLMPGAWAGVPDRRVMPRGGRPGRVLPRHHVSPRSSSSLHCPWYAYAPYGAAGSALTRTPHTRRRARAILPPAAPAARPAACPAGPGPGWPGRAGPAGPAGAPGGAGLKALMAVLSGTGHCSAASPDVISGHWAIGAGSPESQTSARTATVRWPAPAWPGAGHPARRPGLRDVAGAAGTGRPDLLVHRDPVRRLRRGRHVHRQVAGRGYPVR